MSKEKLKNKGITLIALIITIIVMLILTGVTLSITLGDNGLVNKAKEATTQTQIAMDRELLLSAAIGAMGNDGKVNLSAMVLPEGFTGSNGTYTSKNGNTFTVSENGMITITTGNGNITENGDIEGILNGMYHGRANDNEMYYFEIKNNDTLIVEDEMLYNIEIDYENKIIHSSRQYEDGSGNVVLSEFDFQYEIVMEDGEVVNIIIIAPEDYSEIRVYRKNDKGFECELDGTYSNGEITLTYTKDSIYFETDNGYIGYYLKYNGKYYIEGQPAEDFQISSDLNSFVYNGETYIKQ